MLKIEIIWNSFLQVKLQSMSTLWNLSVDDKIRVKVAKSDTLLLAIKYLDDEDSKVKEAAAGVLANLALSRVNHDIMVEAGVIPKLVRHRKIVTLKYLHVILVLLADISAHVILVKMNSASHNYFCVCD